ncbi:MAG: hypothetical protein LIP16_22220 [Clostridium sp.]|nr:hypothetical protein [Clostridium sp.]
MADKQRLFVDMDGTLAVFTPVNTLETLYEQGYFLNQAPHEKVVQAIKYIIANYPDIEVNILSAYLTDSKFALQEKNEWLDRHLPEIENSNRIFVPCGSDKKAGIVGGIRSNDFLLDDYTRNLNDWQPPARGIKLLNAINHTHGSWEFDRIRYDRSPLELADGIAAVMRGERQIFDEKVETAEIKTEAVRSRALEIDEIPITEIAVIDFVRNPDGQGEEGLNRGSKMLESVLSQTDASVHTELCKRYDRAWIVANLKGDFQTKTAILQLREGGENTGRRFADIETLHSLMAEEPELKNYEIVYIREEETRALSEPERERMNDRLYQEFNGDTGMPGNYYGHSLSVGDITVFVNDFDDAHAYFVDTFGFTKLPDDFLSAKMLAMIRNNLDIKQEANLYDRINQFERERFVSVGDEALKTRNSEIVKNYAAIFGLAEQRTALGNSEFSAFSEFYSHGYMNPTGEQLESFRKLNKLSVKETGEPCTLEQVYNICAGKAKATSKDLEAAAKEVGEACKSYETVQMGASYQSVIPDSPIID